MPLDNETRFLCLADFETAARELLPHAVYEYIAAGAGDEITKRDNEAAFDRIRLRPRVLRDLTKLDTGITLFGQSLPHPIILAPVAFQRVAHPEGEVAVARGAGVAEAVFTLSTTATAAIEDCLAVTSSPVWFLDIAWLRSLTTLPFIMKGILDPDDADQAIEAGVDAIVVSNHGARNLDTLPATIDALPAIAERVAGRAPIILDGGVRRGTDVLKAIALGASAVMIGRPYLYALATGGAEGVAHCVNLLRRDFEMAMALTGRARIGEIDKSVIW
jgi:isopentenyl diphosphate isomerase/L-lactate dehydrogenase-like FMN-dependent dehydrogenase